LDLAFLLTGKKKAGADTDSARGTHSVLSFLFLIEVIGIASLVSKGWHKQIKPHLQLRETACLAGCEPPDGFFRLMPRLRELGMTCYAIYPAYTAMSTKKWWEERGATLTFARYVPFKEELREQRILLVAPPNRRARGPTAEIQLGTPMLREALAACPNLCVVETSGDYARNYGPSVGLVVLRKFIERWRAVVLESPRALTVIYTRRTTPLSDDEARDAATYLVPSAAIQSYAFPVVARDAHRFDLESVECYRRVL
jgi:hypothetical protein